MLARAVALWVAGLLTLVPYATYYLLVHATRDQYALLITLVLFWVFGYWSVVGPLIAVVKVRRVFRAIEQATSKDVLLSALRSPDTRDVAIDLVASEYHVPRFIAARVYNLLLKRLSAPAPRRPMTRRADPTRTTPPRTSNAKPSAATGRGSCTTRKSNLGSRRENAL